MKKKKGGIKNPIAKDVRTPKYKMRVVADKKKKQSKEKPSKKDIDYELET